MKNTWWVKADQLDADQRRVIALPRGGSYLLFGPPGSGKTNLLLLRAAFLGKAGFGDLAILTFTRALRDYLSVGAAQYRIQPERVQTLREWLMERIRELGISIPTDLGSLDLLEQRRRVSALVLSHLAQRDIGVLVECVLVDEAQDLLDEEIEVLLRLCRTFFAVADLRQRIYEPTGALDKLRKSASQTLVLRRHYRNGIRICQVADRIASPWKDSPRVTEDALYDESRLTSEVRAHRLSSPNEQYSEICKAAAVQIRAFPGELIGVLAPTNAAVLEFLTATHGTAIEGKVVSREQLEALGLAATEGTIVALTMHASKGLEFRCVHLARAELLKRMPLQRQLAYTAVTRAKTLLDIYSTGSLPGYVEAALSDVSPPAVPPTLESLFPGDPNADVR